MSPVKWLNQYRETAVLGVIVSVTLIVGVLSLMAWSASREGWRTDFEQYEVPPEAFMSGGIGRDLRITPVDQPRFVSVEAAQDWLYERTPVIAVTLDGHSRAYPLTVLLVHEIVNDTLAGVPVAVTYCPLCNSAVVYRREVDGMVLRMGITGNLYGNNFVMYDDKTESWWYQLTGRAVVGEFTGRELEVVPSQVVGFSAFADAFPDGEVLAGDQRTPERMYTMNPYVGYETSSSPMIAGNRHDERLAPMARVLSVVIDGQAVAYSFEALSQHGVINDTIDGIPVVAFWLPGAASPLDTASIMSARDVGQAAIFGREIDGQTLTFRSEDGIITDEQTGSQWNIFGEAVSGELTGTQLPSYTCYAHFWFAWSAAYPDTRLIKDALP